MREDVCRPNLLGFDLSRYLPSYDKNKHFLEQPGLAVCLGHVQKEEPETVFRDMADLSEMIERYPSYYLTPSLELVAAISIEKDNAHGVGDLSCRFAFVVFCLLWDLNYANIGSQEVGYSLLHGVEGMQGGLTRRLNGEPFVMPLLDPGSATEEEITSAMLDLNELVCERVDGATFNGGGGFISVFPAGKQLLSSGFKWRPVELARFLEAAKKGKAASFVFEDMPTFSTYPKLLVRAWQLLNATGQLACTKLTAHTFQWRKNPLNPLCPPPRGTDTVIEDFLDLFGGWTPQPKPAPQTEDDKAAGKFHFMTLNQRILPQNRAPTQVDEFYPKRMMDILVGKSKVLEVYIEGGGKLDDGRLDKLAILLNVTKPTILYDLAERAAKAEHLRKYRQLVDRHKRDGTAAAVKRIVEHVVGKPLGARADWPHIAALKDALKKLKVKHDAKKGKRAVLMEQLFLCWRDLPVDRRPLPAAGSRFAAAPAAGAGATGGGGAGAAVTLGATAAAAAAAGAGHVTALATAPAAAPAFAPVAAPAARAEDQEPDERVDSRELAELARLSELAGAALEGAVFDEEEQEAVELAEEQAEYAAITATIDAAASVVHTCGRCRAVFDEETMVVVKGGQWANNWICLNGGECAAREAGAGLATRKRKAPAHLRAAEEAEGDL